MKKLIFTGRANKPLNPFNLLIYSFVPRIQYIISQLVFDYILRYPYQHEGINSLFNNI